MFFGGRHLFLSHNFYQSHFKFAILFQHLFSSTFLLAGLARRKMSIKIGMEFPIKVKDYFKHIVIPLVLNLSVGD